MKEEKVMKKIVNMVQKDCFGYSEKGKNCRVLKELVCKNKKCSFYKTQKEFQEGLKKYGDIKK